MRRLAMDEATIKAMQKDYDSGLSMRDIIKKYKTSFNSLQKYLKLRNSKEAAKLRVEMGVKLGCIGWSAEERSKRAKAQGFGGYRKNAGRSKKYYVDDSFGKSTCLQSSYEYECYGILEELQIKWIRPKCLNYTLDGKEKRYFPDFYLIDHDIYLDPKNDYLIKKDEEKIKLVRNQNDINLFVLSKNELTIEYFRQMI